MGENSLSPCRLIIETLNSDILLAAQSECVANTGPPLVSQSQPVYYSPDGTVRERDTTG